MATMPPHMHGMPQGPVPGVPDPRERIARFRTITRRAFGFWKTAFLVFVVGCIVSIGVATRIKRIYKSECVVLFKPGMSHSPDENPNDRAMRLAPKLKEMLITRQRLEPLINEYHLYQRIVDSRGMLDAVEEMRQHIAFRGRDSETFAISFESEDALVTQKVTQKVSDTMIDEFSRGNVSSSKQQADFLAEEVKREETTVEKANHDLAAFLAAHPEFAISANQMGQSGSLGVIRAPGITPGMGMGSPGLPGYVPPIAMPSTTDPQLSNLYQQRSRFEAEARAAAGAARTDEKLEPLVRARDEAAARAAMAQADFADKRAKYTDQHPDFIAAKASVDSASRDLQSAEQRLSQARSTAFAASGALKPEIRKGLEAVAAQITARQAELRGAKPASTAAAAALAAAAMHTVVDAGPPEAVISVVELETEWQRLLRSAREARGAHEDLMVKFDKAKLQASATAGTGGDQMEVIDAAFLPTKPTRGGRTVAALAGGLVSLLLAVLYAYGRVVFSDVIIDAGDIEALQLIPVLGVLPRIPNATSSAEAHNKGGSSGVV